MTYLAAVIVLVIIIIVIAFVFWVIPLITREKPQTSENYGSWNHHLHASPSLEWYGAESFTPRKEHYGEPPGMIRGIHQDELGFRGWSDMPGDYEGSSASAVSAYIQRSA